MNARTSPWRTMVVVLLSVVAACCFGLPSMAQDQPAAVAAAATAPEPPPEPLSDDELEVLVARIALYPDELIAVISEASLFPLQVVEAARFLDRVAKDASLKPKDTWDGSVISLLNYPDIVKMMSDDLEWTQTLGDALTYQQKDVLIAIQQLRDKAVTAGAIKSDDKVTVEQSGDNVIIQSTNPEVVYVPQYEPQMLYAANYPIQPISYYPDPYPNYYYPTAPYFAAAVTGAIWAGAMDWDNWGVWGGDWDGGDIDIDCNRCLNNVDIDGKFNFNNLDWKNVDRSKINFDRDKFKNIDRTAMRDRVKANTGNSLRTKAADIRKERPRPNRDRTRQISDVRKSNIEGLKGRAGDGGRVQRDLQRPGGDRTPGINRSDIAKNTGRIDRPVGQKRPAAKRDNRPKNASGLGQVRNGQREKVAAKRGGKSMGGGQYGGGRQHISRGGGGGRQIGGGGGGGRHVSRGGGHRGGGFGGGHRGGGGRRR